MVLVRRLEFALDQASALSHCSTDWMLCWYRLMVRDQVSIAYLHWERTTVWSLLLCVCGSQKLFPLVQLLTDPHIIFWLRPKASPGRNQSNKGIDVSTVSCKSYWHFDPTVFLSNGHSDPPSPATPHTCKQTGPGDLASHCTKLWICLYFQTDFKLLLLFWNKDCRETFYLHSSTKYLNKL